MARKADLVEIYSRYQGAEGGGDKGTIHSYIDIYAEYLDPTGDLLEIGVWEGHSLAMFQEFFTGTVIGLDIDLQRLKFEVNAKLCDATNGEDVAKTLGSQQFDYIIDDGSHRLEDQVKSLGILWHYLKPGGIYFIEDIVSTAVLDNLVRFGKTLEPKNYWTWDLRPQKGRSDDILLALQKVD